MLFRSWNGGRVVDTVDSQLNARFLVTAHSKNFGDRVTCSTYNKDESTAIADECAVMVEIFHRIESAMHLISPTTQISPVFDPKLLKTLAKPETFAAVEPPKKEGLPVWAILLIVMVSLVAVLGLGFFAFGREKRDKSSRSAPRARRGGKKAALISLESGDDSSRPASSRARSSTPSRSRTGSSWSSRRS